MRRTRRRRTFRVALRRRRASAHGPQHGRLCAKDPRGCLANGSTAGRGTRIALFERMRIHELMQRDVTTIGEADDLALALQIMRWRGVRHLPVLARGRVVGMLSEQALLARMSSTDGVHRLTGTAGEAADRNARYVGPDDGLADVAAVLVTAQIDAAAVVEADALVGIVTISDVLSHVAQVPVTPSGTGLDAESVMTSKVVAVHPSARLLDAAAIMVAEGVRHLPVIDGANRIVGILSDRDVRAAVGEPAAGTDDRKSTSVYRLRVADAMIENPRTVAPAASLDEVISVLIRERFGALLVSGEDDTLLGVVSHVDVLEALAGRAT